METADIGRRYAGKWKPRPSWCKISAARVVDNFEVNRLREEGCC